MLKLNKLNEIRSSSGRRSFLLLWASQAVSLLGSEMTNFALTVHVYSGQGTASSVALLKVFYFLPSILLSFAAGTLADRWDKKKTMLAGILAGALTTLAFLVLYSFGSLKVSYLYAINFAVSFVNAFTTPAVYVTITLLAPQDQYVRVSGMQLFSNALATIAAPVLAAGLMKLGGIQSVFAADIASFAVAFFTLLFFVRIPPVPKSGQPEREPFLKSCLTGLAFLRKHRAVWKCILYLALVNFLANLGGDGSMMPAMILARTGGNELSLSAVKAAAGIGLLLGSITVTAAKPANRKARVMFIACAVSFAVCDLTCAFGRSPSAWAVGALLGNFMIPFITANNVAIMRSNVPVELQGRVFAARDTVQYLPIPLGLFLGGFLADRALEPFMAAPSPVQHAFSRLVGTGKGSGMAVIMLITGVAGCLWSLVQNRDPVYRELDSKQ